MKKIICGVILFIFISGCIIIGVTLQPNTPQYIYQLLAPPMLPPVLSPKCYSCIGNPCRSCENSFVSGRYNYSFECCSFCGGCWS